MVVELPPAVPGASFTARSKMLGMVPLVDVGFEGKGGQASSALPPD